MVSVDPKSLESLFNTRKMMKRLIKLQIASLICSKDRYRGRKSLPSAGLECISKAIFASISFSIQWKKRWKRKMPYAASISLLSASIDICNSYAAAQYFMVKRRSFLLNYPFAKVTAEAFASKVPELNSYYYPRMTSSWAGSQCAGHRTSRINALEISNVWCCSKSWVLFRPGEGTR